MRIRDGEHTPLILSDLLNNKTLPYVVIAGGRENWILFPQILRCPETVVER